MCPAVGYAVLVGVLMVCDIPGLFVYLSDGSKGQTFEANMFPQGDQRVTGGQGRGMHSGYT